MLNTPHPEKLGNKYILLDVIGTGGMAEVHRGKLVGDKGFEKLIVIKKLLPHIAKDQDMVAHFTNEARLAALLQHENITAIYDYGELDESFFIVMEYLFGKDLSTIIARLKKLRQPFSPELALLILAKICDGMAYAHKLRDFQDTPFNLIHRDLTPQNIFLTYDGKVKILDFGIAKTTVLDNRTKAGVVKGKMNYMSPEQVMGDPLDLRSDIFSMGILLYEMLSGINFYSGDTGTIIRKSVQVDHTPLHEVTDNLPEQIYSIVQKAISREPDERYQNCDLMGADIRACLKQIKAEPGTKELKEFIHSIFANEYTEEKENAKKILAVDHQNNQQVQFDKTVFITPETEENQDDPMRYAPKNTQKDPIQEAQEASVPEPPALKIPKKKTVKNLTEKKQTPATPQKARQNPRQKKKTESRIPIRDDRYQGSGEKFPKISIETEERPARRRARTGFNLSAITQSFGPFLVAILLIIAGASYFFSNHALNGTTDYFAEVAPPTVPPATDKTELTSAQKEILLFKLTLKGEAALKDGKLISPETENAYVFINQAKRLAPTDNATQKNFDTLVQQLAHRADLALQQGEKEEAAKLIVAGLSISPDNRKLTILKEELSN